MSSLILSSLLLFAEPASDYAGALGRLELATKEANRSTDPATIHGLEQAIDQIERFPVELADDRSGHDQLALAQLSLARLYLANADEAAAARVMDAAIFSAGITPLPTARFGPDIAALHQTRLEALEKTGRAALDVNCNVDCRVYVDGNAITGTSVNLYLGPHQVHVTSASDEPLTVELVIPAEGTRIDYGVAVPTEPPPPATPPPSVPTKTSGLAWGMERPIPKWKLAGIGVSSGVFVASTAAAVGLTMAISARGSVRRELIAAAEDSLTDDKESNDIDPNLSSDLCAAARTPHDPSRPNEVTNAEVTRVCIKADTYATSATALFIVAGVSAASTIVFGVLLNTHRARKSAELLRRHQAGFMLAPRLAGGVTAVAGFRF